MRAITLSFLVCGAMLASQARAAPLDVEAALKAWSDAFAAYDGEKSAALYTQDAVLWGTISAKQTIGQAGLRNYFDAGKQNFKSRTVAYGEHTCRVYDLAAVCSGSYEFELVPNEGNPRKFPSRFSMMFVKQQDGRWLIVDHHSSLVPGPIAK